MTISFLVANRTGREGYFEISIRGIPTTWVLLDIPVLHLGPSEQREVNLTIQPPEQLGAVVGVTPVVITAANQEHPSLAGEAALNLNIGAFYPDGETIAMEAGAGIPRFTSDINPLRAESGKTTRLFIHNTGTMPGSYNVTVHSPGGALEFVPVPEGPITAQPGQQVEIDYVVSPRTPTLLGAPGVYPYTLVVTSSDGEAQAHEGEVVSRPLLPVWVLPALLVACLTAICGMGVIWNWNQSRLVMVTETAVALADIQETAASTGVTATAAQAQTAAFNQTQAAAIGQQDTDGDGLTNQQEQELGFNPQSADSDSDRINDGDEARLGLNALNPDSDGDGIIDGQDLNPLDPLNPALTLTAASALPSVTNTAPLVSTPVPATATNTAAPEDTNPPPPLIVTLTTAPTAVPPTLTVAAAATATSTSVPLPVTGPAQIAFESDREGDPEVYLFSAEEAEEVSRLTNSPGPDLAPAWSPDGSRIAFTSQRDGNSEIYVANADGSSLTNITNHPASDTDPTWTPDGASLLFTTGRDGNLEVYQVSDNGANPVNITNHPADDSDPTVYVEDGLLADTVTVVFTTNRDGNDEIYSTVLGGEDEPLNLTQNPAPDTQPDAAPDGETILFTSDRDGNAEIYRMESDGANPTNLTENPAADTSPDWSPDADLIAFVSDRDGNEEVYVMEPDGSNPTNVTQSDAADQAPDWR